MKNLFQKVLKTKEQYNHTVYDIDDIVKSNIAELNKQYNTRYDRNKTRERYTSEEYKLFITYTGKDEKTYSQLFDRCIINETNIANFVNGKTKRPQDRTKDFFAVYCGYQGYNDFLISGKNIESTKGNENSIETLEIADEKQGNGLRRKLNSIPYVELENYILRVEILENISDLFKQGKKKINITGISGLGKTFLAKHFVQHYSKKFSHIVWLNCLVGFVKAFSNGNGVELLDKMGLTSEYKSCTEGNMSEEALTRMVLGRLKDLKGNNILILDNLDEDIYYYEDEIHLSDDWKILTTSQQALDGFYDFTAPYLKKESIHLFYKYYTKEKDDENLIPLLSAVEYHTLTVELLAKTAQKGQLDILELVNRFVEKGINVVEKVKVISDHSKEREVKIENIEAYLDIVFDTSSLDDEQCKILLNIALLQTDSIATELFKEVYLNNATEYKVIDIFKYNLSILSDKGWVQIQDNRIRIHSLVKGIVIKRFLHRTDFFNATINYLGEVFKTGTQDNLQKIEYLTMTEPLLEIFTEVNEDTINLRKRISMLYASMELYEKAIKFWDELEETEDVSDIADAIEMFHNLASINLNWGNNEKALFYGNKAHSLMSDDFREKLYDFVIKDLNTSLTNTSIDTPKDFKDGAIVVIGLILGCHCIIVMCDKNKNPREKIIELKQIILTHDRILSSFEQNVSEDIIFSINQYRDWFLKKDSILRVIGAYYASLEEYEMAEEFLKMNLETKEKLETEHLDLFRTYNFLTGLYLEWKKPKEARHFIEKNKIVCDKFPPDHPSVHLLKDSITRLEELEQNG